MISLTPDTARINESGTIVDSLLVGDTPGTCCSTEITRKNKFGALLNWNQRNFGKKLAAVYFVVYTEFGDQVLSVDGRGRRIIRSGVGGRGVGPSLARLMALIIRAIGACTLTTRIPRWPLLSFLEQFTVNIKKVYVGLYPLGSNVYEAFPWLTDLR